MTFDPIAKGTVSWTGENPGIYLKERPDGPWTGLVTFFRITWSEFGRGHGALLLEDPSGTSDDPNVVNAMISDNQPLAEYLMEEFFQHFAAFKASDATKQVEHRKLTDIYREGSSTSTYSEVMKAEDLELRMTWRGLGTPYAVDMPPESGPTKKHRMFSLFVDAEEAAVTVNGRKLKGSVDRRGFAGGTKSSAFLAFSETWIEI